MPSPMAADGKKKKKKVFWDQKAAILEGVEVEEEEEDVETAVAEQKRETKEKRQKVASVEEEEEIIPDKTKKKKEKQKQEKAASAEGAKEDAAAEKAPEEKQGKKRKRDAGLVAQQTASEAVPAKEGRKAKKRRKALEAKQKAAEEGKEEVEDDEEAKRRLVQRELQKLVVKLRKEGKTEAEVKLAKREFRTAHPDVEAADSRKELKRKEWMEWMKTDTGERKTKEDNKAHKHDLVIIPVAWRGRHDQLEVQTAAEDIKDCVAQQGVDVWIDSRRQLTPGQKFAHWEHRGVMLRVEVGPDDLKLGKCKVCLAKTPGDYQSVQKASVRLPPAGARKLLLQLKEFGLSKIDIEKREGDSDSDQEDMAALPAKAAKAAKAAAADDDDDVLGNYTPRVNRKDESKHKNKKQRAFTK